MRSFHRLLFIFISFMVLSNPFQLNSEDNQPAYIGVWKGTDIGDFDYLVFFSETEFKLEAYKAGNNEIIPYMTIRGTHGILEQNKKCMLKQTEEWNGTAWMPFTDEHYIEFSIDGIIMSIKYNNGDINDIGWQIETQLTRQ